MTTPTIDISKEVEKDLPEVRLLTGKTPVQEENGRGPKTTLYQLVVESLAQNTRNTPKQVEYLEVFETTVAVFRSASRELRKAMDVMTLEQRLGTLREAYTEQEQLFREQQTTIPELQELSARITNAVLFSNRYALCFAGYIGLGLLHAEKAEVEAKFQFGTKYEGQQQRDLLTAKLLQATGISLQQILSQKAKLQEPTNDEDLKHTLEAVFTSWMNQFSWVTFKDIAEKFALEQSRLQYGSYSMLAGVGKKKHDRVEVDEKIMDCRKEEVIGTSDLAVRLWNNFIKLAAYDPERKKNPYDPANVIFTFGEPGGGKTYTAHAYIQSFAEFCRQKGIALWAMTHSTTDYATEYQNQTPKHLAELGERIKRFPGIVVMYVADADNIFQSRKDPTLKGEHLHTLGVYFKMFDGTMIPRNGKFLAVMDANYIDGIDDATKSRLFDEIVEVKRFSKAEDFAELARRALTKGLGTIGVVDAEWLGVGNYLLQSPLSNREIGHVLRQLRRDFDVPEDMIGKPFDVHVQYRNQHLQDTTLGKITGKFDAYIATRMEIERKSREAKLKQNLERFLYNIVQEKEGGTGAAGVPSPG